MSEQKPSIEIPVTPGQPDLINPPLKTPVIVPEEAPERVAPPEVDPDEGAGAR